MENRTLEEIESEIISLCEEDQELYANPTLEQLLIRRKQLIDYNYSFDEQNISEFIVKNNWLVKLEEGAKKQAEDFLEFQSSRLKHVDNFDVSAWVKFSKNSSELNQTYSSNQMKLIQALESFGNPCLFSYQYDSEEKQFEILRNVWLPNIQWESCLDVRLDKSAEIFEKLNFCNAWSVLHDYTYYSLNDILMLNTIEIQINQHLNFEV